MVFGTVIEMATLKEISMETVKESWMDFAREIEKDFEKPLLKTIRGAGYMMKDEG